MCVRVCLCVSRQQHKAEFSLNSWSQQTNRRQPPWRGHLWTGGRGTDLVRSQADALASDPEDKDESDIPETLGPSVSIKFSSLSEPGPFTSAAAPFMTHSSLGGQGQALT